MSGVYDLAVVGGGILGLAHAYEAARRGKRVVVIDRDAQANGASVRNFGFVTVTGQDRGTVWRRAMKSRDVWAEIAPKAGIRGREPHKENHKKAQKAQKINQEEQRSLATPPSKNYLVPFVPFCGQIFLVPGPP